MDVRAAMEDVRTSTGDAGPEFEEQEWEGPSEWMYTMRPGTAVRYARELVLRYGGGVIVEIADPSPHEDLRAPTVREQVTRYWGRYRLVLVTNLRELGLVGPDPDGSEPMLESFRLAESEETFAHRAVFLPLGNDAVPTRGVCFLG